MIIYDYQPGHGHEYLEAFLAGYKGDLQCDGYRVYGYCE
ncbi:IS66 family transposase [Psychromonas sp. MB-3u-54]